MPQLAKSSSLPYRPDIDGLRAIAIFSVVAFHAFPNTLKSGFIGVDIFFVISGFLISSIIFSNLQRNSFSIVEFYRRRIRRIFPALITVLLACFALGWFLLLADEYKQLGRHIAGGAGFVSNFLLWNEDGYFDNAADTKPLLHLWSLGIEEQYYIAWPLLLWLASKARLNLLAVAVVVAVTSFAINLFVIGYDNQAAFYSPQTRFWELMIGSTLAYLLMPRTKTVPENQSLKAISLNWQKLSPKLHDSLRNFRSVLGAAFLATGFVLVTSESRYPGALALLPTLGTALIISGGPKAWINRSILSNRVLVWFGLISFSLYLWHWPLLSFARIVESQTPAVGIRVTIVLISVLLAWLTYRLVEMPIRFGQSYNLKSAALVLAMVAVGYAGYETYQNDGLRFRSLIETTDKIDREFVGPLWRYTTNDTCLTQHRFPDAYSYPWWFCVKSQDRKPTILLLGNSFANQLYPGLAINERLKHHSVLSIGACDPVQDDNQELRSPCRGRRQLDQQQLTNDIIDQSGSIEFVIIDGLNSRPTAEYIGLLQKRIDFIEQHGAKVIIFTPHLRPGFDPKKCFARPLKKAEIDCSFSVDVKTAFYNQFKPLIDTISKSNPNVLFFDQHILHCDSKSCSFIQDGVPLHRDNNHLSEFGSIELAKHFVKWAESHAPEMLDYQ